MEVRKNHLLCFQTPGIGQKLIFKKSIMGESFDIFTLKVAYKAFLTVYSVKRWSDMAGTFFRKFSFSCFIL